MIITKITGNQTVGFGLTHGKPAIAWAQFDKNSSPDRSNLLRASGRQHVTTAVEHPDRGVLVGQEAVVPRGLTRLYVLSTTPQSYVPIELTAHHMQEVMNTPQPTLSGPSWLEAFRAGLHMTMDQLSGRRPRPCCSSEAPAGCNPCLISLSRSSGRSGYCRGWSPTSLWGTGSRLPDA